MFLFCFVIVFILFNTKCFATSTEKLVEEKNSTKTITSKVVETNISNEEVKKDNSSKSKSKNSKDSHKKTKNDKKKKTEEIDYSDIKIIINEILPNPEGKDSGNEFIEIYNYGDKDVDLKDWKLIDSSVFEKVKKDSDDSIDPEKIDEKFSKKYSLDSFEKIDENSYLILYNKKDFSFSLNNSNETIYLISPDNKTFSKFYYKDSTEGKSWNYDQKEWYLSDPTPENENVENPANKKYPKIIINEIFPDAIGSDVDKEFIELYNPNDENIDLKDWKLTYVASNKNSENKTEREFVFTAEKIKSKEFLLLKNVKDKNGKKNSIFDLRNNSKENDVVTLNLISPNSEIKYTVSYSETIEGQSFNFNENEKNWYWANQTPNKLNNENPLTKTYPEIIINEVLANPKGSDIGNEFIEIYNPNDEKVNLSGWILADKSKEKTLENVELKPFEYLVLYQKKDFSFTLNNADEKIYLKSPNPNIVTTFSYAKSTEGLSLNFDEKENYSAKPSPREKNNENPLTKKYPNLLLSEILPNPIGEEKTDEFIEIYNPNDFEVNLESWILKDATLTGNYIFNESQKINAKSYFTIYRKDFKFALNNTNESVYLIAPNQKIKSQIDYEKSRENISYNFDLKNENWRWSKFITPNTENKFNNLPEIKNLSIDKKSYKNVYTEFNVKAFDVDKEDLKYRWDFGDGRKSYLNKTRHKYLETGTYYGSLRIQDGSEEIVKNFTVEVKKYPKHKIEIIKIVPNPKGLDSGNEYLIIKNNSKEKINLQNWSIATGTKKDRLINHPIREKLEIKSKEDQKITREYSAISLPNKTAFIELRRPDGSVADKISYEKDKIENDESYEKIDGKWQWTLNEDPLEKLRVQEIIAQALLNEKIWQKENFQQKIIEKFVNQKSKNSKDKKETYFKEKFFLTKFLEKINLFLGKYLFCLFFK